MFLNLTPLEAGVAAEHLIAVDRPVFTPDEEHAFLDLERYSLIQAVGELFLDLERALDLFERSELRLVVDDRDFTVLDDEGCVGPRHRDI